MKWFNLILVQWNGLIVHPNFVVAVLRGNLAANLMDHNVYQVVEEALNMFDYNVGCAL